MIYLVEPILEGLKASLEISMPGHLDTINDHYGDFALVDIAAYHIGERGKIPRLPAVVLIGEESISVAESPQHMTAENRITVAVVAEDADEERLARQLYRYTAALLAGIQGYRQETGYIVTFDTVTYSPLYPTEAYVMDARVVIRVTRVEGPGGM